MSFGDYNVDGFTDIVCVDSLSSTVMGIYLWDNSVQEFTRK